MSECVCMLLCMCERAGVCKCAVCVSAGMYKCAVYVLILIFFSCVP